MTKLECFYCGHSTSNHNDLFGCEESWITEGEIIACGCHMFPAQIEAVDNAAAKDARIASLEAALADVDLMASAMLTWKKDHPRFEIFAREIKRIINGMKGSSS
jgi:hypothetical protein